MGKKGDEKEKDEDADPGKLAREYVNPTPKGAMKSFAEPMATAYHPHEVEASWNDWQAPATCVASAPLDPPPLRIRYVRTCCPPASCPTNPAIARHSFAL